MKSFYRLLFSLLVMIIIIEGIGTVNATNYQIAKDLYNDSYVNLNGVNSSIVSNQNINFNRTIPESFSIAVISDTQLYIPGTYENISKNETLWLRNNINALNLKLVINTGDIVEHANITSEWDWLNQSYSQLDGYVNYSLIPGNHDYDSYGNYTTFNRYFGVSRYENNGFWKGSYPIGNNENNYGTFIVGQETYLVMGLEYCPLNVTLDWARTILNNNTDKTVIIFTHSYMNYDGNRVNSSSPQKCSSGNNGEDIYNYLVSQYNNILLVQSGHIINNSFGATAHRTDTVNGKYLINQDLINQQSSVYGGIRIYTFNASISKILATTYSSYNQTYWVGENYTFNFSYPLYNNEYTIQSWWNLKNNTAENFVITSYTSSTDGNFALRSHENGTTLRFNRFQPLNTLLASSVGIPANNNVWRLVTVSVAWNETRFYVNNISYGSTVATGNPIFNISKKLLIGKYDGGTTNTNGSINSIKIYNDALTLSNVSTIFNLGMNTTTNILLNKTLYSYNLNEGEGIKSYDDNYSDILNLTNITWIPNINKYTHIFIYSNNLNTPYLNNNLPTTITSLNSTYDSSLRKVSLNCSGTGNIVLNNLNTLGTSYRVYHNGVLVETTNTVNYTINSCSEWLFVGSCAYLDGNYTFNYNVTNPTCFINNATGVLNLTLINYSQAGSFNDIKNTSNNVILASNVNIYSITLSPNQQIEVGDYVESPNCINVSGNISFQSTNNTHFQPTFCVNNIAGVSINVSLVNFNLQSPYNSVKVNGVWTQTSISNASFIVPASGNLTVLNSGGCVIPVEDYAPAVSMTIAGGNPFCDGVYYLNDSNMNGVIRPNAANITIECNGTIFSGNVNAINFTGSRAFSFAKNNVTIRGCTFTNYSRGINADSVTLNVYENNSFIDIFNVSIFVRYSNPVTIRNNYFIMTNTTRVGTSFDYNHVVHQYTNGSQIYGNTFIGGYYTIDTYFSNYTSVYNNTFINSTQDAIYEDRGYNSQFYNSSFYNTKHNAIDITGYNHLIYNNYISGSGHNGIDGASNTEGSGHSVYNNNITDGYCSGIYFNQHNNTKIYNNYINNIQGIGGPEGNCTGTVIHGIQITANISMGVNMLIENNTINNISNFNGLYKVCMFIQPYNTTFKNNTLTNCGNYSYLVQTWGAGINNMTIINVGQENRGTTIYDASAVNLALQSFNTASPYNDIKNSSNGNILASNVDNYSITLSPNQQIEVGDFTSGYILYAPNILSIYDINSNNYFDRLVKSFYGNIPRLPDNLNGYQSSAMVSQYGNGSASTTYNLDFPIRDQINAYSSNWANSTAIDIASLKVCYGTIYGGRTCTTNFTYTLT